MTELYMEQRSLVVDLVGQFVLSAGIAFGAANRFLRYYPFNIHKDMLSFNMFYLLYRSLLV